MRRMDPGRRVRLTALGLALLNCLTMTPALRYWDLAAAPGWARAVMLLGLLELAYAAWLASVPDWGALWAVMFVLAAHATLYGAAAAAALAVPPHDELPLGLSAVRGQAPLWCAMVAALTVAAAYWCGHLAQTMRRSQQ